MNKLRRVSSVLAISAATVALAAGPDGLDLSWHTIDGGGGVSNGGSLQMSGTIGQPDPGTMSAGDLTLTGGFWSVRAAVEVLGDIDGNGVVNLLDFVEYLNCLTGPGAASIPTGCEAANLNDDSHIDMADFHILQQAIGVQ